MQVWQENLDAEMALIRDIIDDYPFLAMGEPSTGIAIDRTIGPRQS